MSKLKYGMAAVGAIAASVGVASLSPPYALAGEHMGARHYSTSSIRQQSWASHGQHDRALKQECDTRSIATTNLNLFQNAKSTRQISNPSRARSRRCRSQCCASIIGHLDRIKDHQKVTSVVKETWDGPASPTRTRGPGQLAPASGRVPAGLLAKPESMQDF